MAEGAVVGALRLIARSVVVLLSIATLNDWTNVLRLVSVSNIDPTETWFDDTNTVTTSFESKRTRLCCERVPITTAVN